MANNIIVVGFSDFDGKSNIVSNIIRDIIFTIIKDQPISVSIKLFNDNNLIEIIRDPLSLYSETINTRVDNIEVEFDTASGEKKTTPFFDFSRYLSKNYISYIIGDVIEYPVEICCAGCKHLHMFSFDHIQIKPHYDEIDQYVGLFENCTCLKKVEGVDISLLKSGINMFRNCYSLEFIPSSLRGLENLEVIDFAFENCISLKEVNIDLSKTELANSTFKGCVTLKRAIIRHPENLEITPFMFANCTQLDTVLIEEGELAPTLATGMFLNCHKLDDITNSINYKNLEVGEGMFYGIGINCRSIIKDDSISYDMVKEKNLFLSKDLDRVFGKEEIYK